MSEPFHELASIDYPILDADAHVYEPPDVWQARVPSGLPPMWGLNIERRHDGDVRISTSGVDPEVALAELVRYARADAR